MASSISVALRRATGTSPTLYSKFLGNPINVIRCTSVLPSVCRSFNTGAQMTNYEDDSTNGVDVDRRYVSRRRDSAPSFFSDVFDPFGTRSLSQMLNVMDQFMDNPLLAASRPRRGWDVKEDKDALFLRIDMPGLSKENVRVSVEQSTLVVRGEGGNESLEEESGRRYSSRLDLPPNLYKLDSVKAEMKNGVLKLVVPKVKEEEKKDVFQVKID